MIKKGPAEEADEDDDGEDEELIKDENKSEYEL